MNTAAMTPAGDIADARGGEAAVEDIARSFAEADRHEASLAGYAVEDWVCLVFFWAMTVLVFLQFFSRYVLNDSFAWTEELATYCLMPVVFIGSAACVRRCRHIQVNLVYRWLPPRPGRMLASGVALLLVLFFAYASWLTARYALAVDTEPMTTLPWRKSLVYWLAFSGFVAMTARAVQVGWQDLRRGYSALEKPEAFDTPAGES